MAPRGILPARQDALLRLLAPVSGRRGFYLAGGTAVALHLHHRQSADFDWFSERAITDPLVLAESLRGDGIALSTVSVAPGTLHAKVGGVPVSFLAYPYPLLRRIPDLAPYGCPIASLDDLAAMKVAAIAQRGTKRDFIDVHAIGGSGLTLEKMLGLYRSKYGVKEIGHAVEALTYFDDAEREAMPKMRTKVTWARVKSDIRSWVRLLGART